LTNRRVIIALKGLGALANHGVYDFERSQEQRFSADVVMWVETAGATDDIAATVSYADIADEAMAVLTGTAVDLAISIDPEVIGGFRLRAGMSAIDASLATRIAAARSAITS